MSTFKSRKPKPAQLEVQWLEPESFTLIAQTAVDGERVAREAAQRTADQQASDEQQARLL